MINLDIIMLLVWFLPDCYFMINHYFITCLSYDIMPKASAEVNQNDTELVLESSFNNRLHPFAVSIFRIENF